MRIEGDINSARIFIFIEYFLPSLATIRSAEDATLRIGAERMAQRGHIHDVWIPGVDNQFSNGARIPQANVFPRLATIERFVNPISVGDVATDACLSRTDVDDVRLRRRHRQAADAPDCFFIKERGPSHGAVGRLPYSAARRAEVIGVRVPRDSRRRQGSPTTERTNWAVFQSLEDRVFLFRGCSDVLGCGVWSWRYLFGRFPLTFCFALRETETCRAQEHRNDQPCCPACRPYGAMHLILSREEVESPMLTRGPASGKEWCQQGSWNPSYLATADSSWEARKPHKLPLKVTSDPYLRRPRSPRTGVHSQRK